jgi:hypothetical protein
MGDRVSPLQQKRKPRQVGGESFQTVYPAMDAGAPLSKQGDPNWVSARRR